MNRIEILMNNPNMCPKCGNPDGLTKKKYCKGEFLECSKKEEHLHRICVECGYDSIVKCWDEKEE